MRLFLALLCVLATAAEVLAAPDASLLAGRWQGSNYRMAALSQGCDGMSCSLTLDIAPCGESWCGVEVGKDDACGATVFRISKIEAVASGGLTLSGKLELAEGTEPYVIEAFVEPATDGLAAPRLNMTGDTGGEFRLWRRTFPFHAALARIGEPLCRDSQKPVS